MSALALASLVRSTARSLRIGSASNGSTHVTRVVVARWQQCGFANQSSSDDDGSSSSPDISHTQDSQRVREAAEADPAVRYSSTGIIEHEIGSEGLSKDTFLGARADDEEADVASTGGNPDDDWLLTAAELKKKHGKWYDLSIGTPLGADLQNPDIRPYFKNPPGPDDDVVGYGQPRYEDNVLRYEYCPVCSSAQPLDYKNVYFLSKFVSSDGRILPRSVTGVCKRQQKRLTRAIKHSRSAGYMPYTGKLYFDESMPDFAVPRLPPKTNLESRAREAIARRKKIAEQRDSSLGDLIGGARRKTKRRAADNEQQVATAEDSVERDDETFTEVAGAAGETPEMPSSPVAPQEQSNVNAPKPQA
eukprot:Clim_evm31s2 gene=Clim_evmTU31s2